MGVPMTAKEQLLRAQELGHELSIITRGPWPEHNDPHPKYWLRCSCGWSPNGSSRSRKALNARMVWHLGQVLAEGVSSPKNAGGNR